MRAVIYCRISRDAEERGEGVARQQTDCRALCERSGFEVAEVYVENDTGASAKSRKPRPLYAEMMRRARAGEFDVIVAYSNSRLTRRVREYLDLIDLAERGNVRIATVVSGDHNLATADGRGAALTVAVWDAAEAERTSERVKRAKVQAAQEGRYRGGKRPYGFERDGIKHREPEAQVIRDATAAILAGRSLRAVANELNEQGRHAVRDRRAKGDEDGKVVRDDHGRVVREDFTVEWTGQRLRDVLIRPRNAGLLSSGRADRGEADVKGKAEWDPIVSEDQWHALYQTLTEPSRRTSWTNDAQRLGSYIYVCGICGETLRVGSHRGVLFYRCARAHLGIHVAKTDRFVKAAVAEKLRDPRVVATMTEPDPDLAEFQGRRTDLEARLTSFLSAVAEGTLTPDEYRKVADKVTAELADVQARIDASVRRSTSSSVLSEVDPGGAFLDAPIDVQRAVLRMVTRVTIVPASEARDEAKADERTPQFSDRIRLSEAPDT